VGRSCCCSPQGKRNFIAYGRNTLVQERPSFASAPECSYSKQLLNALSSDFLPVIDFGAFDVYLLAHFISSHLLDIEFPAQFTSSHNFHRISSFHVLKKKTRLPRDRTLRQPRHCLDVNLTNLRNHNILTSRCAHESFSHLIQDSDLIER
jgi:hypothetical protein